MLAFEIASSAPVLADLLAALVRRHHPGSTIRLCDSQSPECATVRLAGSDRWIFIATGRQPDAAMAEALSRGASGVLSVTSATPDVTRSLACLVTDAAPFAPLPLLRWLSNEVLAPKPVALPTRLTARERSVLALIASGCSNAEIAMELTISENTVRTHVRGLLQKFGGNSRTRMLAHARALRVPEALGLTRATA
jgi:DNA-binding NarL/FixJ family response regulator